MMELEKAGLNRFQRIISISTINSVFCNENEKISEAIDKIIQTEHEKLPVVTKKNHLVGLIGPMDILDAFLRKENLNEKISKIMVRDIIFCDARDTLEFVLQKIKLSRKGTLPVVSKEMLVGVVGESDFVKHFSETKFGTTVSEIMTKKPFFLLPDASVMDGLKSAVNTKYRRLPVVQNGKLSGLFAAVDILKLIKSNLSLSQSINSMMVKNVFTITGDKDLSDAIKVMRLKNIDGLPVVDDENRLEGIITERDILEEIV
jgi:CBS domain-containing protein